MMGAMATRTRESGAGFEAAFRELYPRPGLALRMLGNRAVAETWPPRMARRVAQWGRSTSTAAGWVLRVTSNQAIDLPGARRGTSMVPEVIDLGDGTAPPDRAGRSRCYVSGRRSRPLLGAT
jgi:DNA-directed RNA polymerase specialized sigma24 family protein